MPDFQFSRFPSAMNRALRLILVLLALAGAPARACTIFVLTDAHRTLFFNNEDWFNAATRLWFVPAGKDHLGCAYVGFNDGWAQGGLNTAGLAFDWVAGFEENYLPDPKLQPARGNSSERMLESCTTVDEAIAFYGKFLEPDFKRGRILIADRTGASVIIGSLNGKFHTARQHRSRGYGWGRAAVDAALAKSPEPTIENGAAILRACLQPGDGGTKYSNVFDLKSGEIVLFPFPGRDENVKLNLAAELAKGGHFYDIGKIRGQVTAAPRPLLANMQRFYLDAFSPLADQESAVTERLRSLLRDAAAGTMRSEAYTAELWARLAPREKEILAQVAQLGPLQTLTLVERTDSAARRSYRYIIEFAKARVLQRYELDAEGKIAALASEFSEPKRH
jgi:hypothetical protein